jgi:heme-degrading monooxygenase HmoA
VIIRVFRPTVHPGKEQEFEAFLRDTAVPLVSQQSGLIAQHVGRPRDPSSMEYLYVTVWEDVASIRAFAGERWQEAVVTPDEEHLLKDTWIGHYEVLPTPDERSSLAPTQPADCTCVTASPACIDLAHGLEGSGSLVAGS